MLPPSALPTISFPVHPSSPRALVPTGNPKGHLTSLCQPINPRLLKHPLLFLACTQDETPPAIPPALQGAPALPALYARVPSARVQQCHHRHSSVWQGLPQVGRSGGSFSCLLSLYPSRGAALAVPVFAASSPTVSMSPTHRRSKTGSFPPKSIKAGVRIEVATAAQQWGLVPVGGRQVLLFHPVQDGQGIATS